MEALSLLYDRHLELVYGVCLKYLRDSALAEDAAVGIFEHLLEKLPQHEVHNFRSWLHTVCRNYCLMQLRKKEVQLVENTDPMLMHSLNGMHPIQEEAPVEKEQMLNDMEYCIEKLADQQKHCIRLFYLEEKSYKEIADSLSEPLGTVRSHIQNGRRNLRLCMEQKNETSR